MILFDQKESGYMSNYAYVTLVTKDSYLEGAHYLHHSLKRAQSKYPLIIMVTENIEDLINQNSENYTYRVIPHYSFECNYGGLTNKECINKLYAFNFTEYDKLFYLDADCLVFENIDFIFNEGKQYEFLAGLGTWDEKENSDNWRVLGQCFLLTPEKNKFYKFLAEYDKQEIFSDEKAFASYFYPNYKNEQSQKERELIYKIYSNTYHDGGLLKYWQILDTTNYHNYFNDWTQEEIKNYFTGYQAFKIFSYNYTRRSWNK